MLARPQFPRSLLIFFLLPASLLAFSRVVKITKFNLKNTLGFLNSFSGRPELWIFIKKFQITKFSGKSFKTLVLIDFTGV